MIARGINLSIYEQPINWILNQLGFETNIETLLTVDSIPDSINEDIIEQNMTSYVPTIPRVCSLHCNNNREYVDSDFRNELIEKNRNLCIVCNSNIETGEDSVQSCDHGHRVHTGNCNEHYKRNYSSCPH